MPPISGQGLILSGGGCGQPRPSSVMGSADPYKFPVPKPWGRDAPTRKSISQHFKSCTLTQFLHYCNTISCTLTLLHLIISNIIYLHAIMYCNVMYVIVTASTIDMGLFCFFFAKYYSLILFIR
jgi:hypothetical protein